MKRWFSRDSVRARIGIGVVAFLMFAGVAGSMRHAALQNATVSDAQASAPVAHTQAGSVDLSEKQKLPLTETKIVTTEEDVPYSTTQTYDGTLPKDTEVVKVEGVNGKKVVKEEVKTRDGVEISRELISEEITVPPVAKVVAVGTKVMPRQSNNAGGNCDGHYSPCVPKTSDALDCADIGHQVKIVTPGDDPLNLDMDGDGIGCDNYPKPNTLTQN